MSRTPQPRKPAPRKAPPSAVAQATESVCRLYLLTPPAFEPAAFASLLTAALDAGDVAALQIRLKQPDGRPVDDDQIRRAVDALRPVATARGVAVILNDRPDLAVATGCDGVHVGPDDAPYDQARKLVGAQAIVGVSAKTSRHDAMVAAESGADYVAFGAFFQTSTKQDTAPADVELLTWWSEMMETPCVAIGGITPANCAPLVAAGADFLAVSAGVWAWPEGPAAAVAAFQEQILDASR